jgi:acetyl esterase/lipase
MKIRRTAVAILIYFTGFFNAFLPAPSWSDEPTVINLWPERPPGETAELPPEADQTRPDDKLIAGRRIIKLGNVSTPQMAVFRPDPTIENGTAVVICPGGGHYILAYDLEGTEVAQWLNSLGVTAIVLKYRVPARDKENRYRAAVQDAQRCMSIVRSRAEEWNIDPSKIGICGFSAGGQTAALTSVLDERLYQSVDKIDEVSSRPDFAMLIYPGGLVNKKKELQKHIKITDQAPPMFLVHAFDDDTSVHHSLAMASALKDVSVPAELHLFASGGHGYGLRETVQPVTRWPQLAKSWLIEMGLMPSVKMSGNQDPTRIPNQ